MAVCLGIAIPSFFLGKLFPIIGGAVIAILFGMIITLFWNEKGKAAVGIKFTSKYILQAAVVLLGFGMNLRVIFQTGKQSLPIIVCTIATSLIVAWGLQKLINIPKNTYILIGVGSSICGGSAVAATAPVIAASDEEVAQSISVIFFYNVIAAIIFPIIGKLIGFSTKNGEAFGIFAGTAINDTSSVTAAASTWDSMWKLGSETLDKAVTVKLTRTLAIIPITLALAIIRTQKMKKQSKAEKMAEIESSTENINNKETENDKEDDIVNEKINENEEEKEKETVQEKETSNDSKNEKQSSGFSLKNSFPFFILYFIVASIITTIAISLGASSSVFTPLKELSKFCIIMAMSAIGLNSNLIKLIKSGGKPIILGACCWIGISAVSLILQKIMGIW
ncbi:hypothetical protein BCR36DRAFT_583716 [Piromyces finnis]|uniref:Sulfate exporter family transporter n=1 Tax=Piromyces finnis TaxID=1754191 RepID=A0A1Y1V986_9FUNG|nr:hypothetical protein BCR36DRAFT_583716 [Piromyces finnis]|eukprot:ORX49646.1 hypothetical protein BCR36DRAFT_583716 [Piromyces finnis]